MILFIVTSADLTPKLEADIRERVRSSCSPRHVPDQIVRVPGVPKTLTGKLLEVPIKRLLMGHDAQSVANTDALQNPSDFQWFVNFARERRVLEPESGLP